MLASSPSTQQHHASSMPSGRALTASPSSVSALPKSSQRTKALCVSPLLAAQSGATGAWTYTSANAQTGSSSRATRLATTASSRFLKATAISSTNNPADTSQRSSLPARSTQLQNRLQRGKRTQPAKNLDAKSEAWQRAATRLSQWENPALWRNKAAQARYV